MGVGGRGTVVLAEGTWRAEASAGAKSVCIASAGVLPICSLMATTQQLCTCVRTTIHNLVPPLPSAQRLLTGARKSRYVPEDDDAAPTGDSSSNNGNGKASGAAAPTPAEKVEA